MSDWIPVYKAPDWLSEVDFDYLDDRASLEHYKMHGNSPRLMPDLTRIGEVCYNRFR